MKDINVFTAKLGQVMSDFELIENLKERIEILEDALSKLQHSSSSGWVTLSKAAKEMNSSEAALRQRIKNPTNPLPEGIVWKQRAVGCSIFVNLEQLGEYL